MTKDGPRRQIVTLRTALLAVTVAALGILLMYVAAREDWWKGRGAAQDLIHGLGGLLVVAVALAMLWELFGKRAFADEIFEKARVSTDITAAGLLRVTNLYLQKVDWDDYFRSVSKLDIFLSYGRTWRNNNWTNLSAAAAKSGTRIRVVLPDPGDLDLMKMLARRFGQDVDELTASVREAAAAYWSLKQDGGAEIEVYYRRGDLMFSYYRFDGVGIFVLYSHSRQRTNVPTFVCHAGGSLYAFLRNDFDEIVKQSRRVQSPPKKREDVKGNGSAATDAPPA